MSNEETVDQKLVDDYMDAARKTFNTDAGKKFLKYAKELNLEPSAKVFTATGKLDGEATLCNLAVQEYIRSIINTVEGGEEAIEKIKILEPNYESEL